SNTQIGNGTPKHFACPNQENDLGTPRTPNPFVIRKAIPRIMVSVPRVMMMGEMLIRQTIKPLINPSAAPSRIPATHATGEGSVLASIADETAHSAYCDPIERSMFPLIIRKAVPRLAMP